jgi:nitrite reductase/ring-hydroxylating ferredoxin subunit/uncharacterized membrane protein
MRSSAAVEAVTGRVERASGLDGAVGVAKRRVDAVLPPGPVRDLLHGVWAGHPMHPAMVIVPLGSWIGASVLDVLPGEKSAARTLVGLGTLSAAPAALMGWADWADLHPQQQRTGIVHAAGNGMAVALQAASWQARRRGAHARGAALSLAAVGLAGLAGWLGGHLAYRQSAGANHAEQAEHVLPDDYTRLCALDDLPDGRPVQLVLAANPVFVLRRGDRVDVLFDQCAHLSGPLSDGELTGSGDDLCVVCPWHGSVFRVADGQVQRGPSTHPAPVLETRVDADGSVLARLPAG